MLFGQVLAHVQFVRGKLCLCYSVLSFLSDIPFKHML